MSQRKKIAWSLFTTLVLGLLPGCGRQPVLRSIQPLNEKTSDAYHLQDDVMICIKRLEKKDQKEVFGGRTLRKDIVGIYCSINNLSNNEFILDKNSIGLPLIPADKVIKNMRSSLRKFIVNLTWLCGVGALISGIGAGYFYIFWGPFGTAVTSGHGGISSAGAALFLLWGVPSITLSSTAIVVYYGTATYRQKEKITDNHIQYVIEKKDIKSGILNIPSMARADLLVFVKQSELPSNFTISLRRKTNDSSLNFDFSTNINGEICLSAK